MGRSSLAQAWLTIQWSSPKEAQSLVVLQEVLIFTSGFETFSDNTLWLIPTNFWHVCQHIWIKKYSVITICTCICISICSCICIIFAPLTIPTQLLLWGIWLHSCSPVESDKLVVMHFNLLHFLIFPIGQEFGYAFQFVTFPCGNAFQFVIVFPSLWQCTFSYLTPFHESYKLYVSKKIIRECV